MIVLQSKEDFDIKQKINKKLCAIARNVEYTKESPKGDSFVYMDIFLEYDNGKQRS
ncbi:MAG: hypothetical protein U9O20_03180 [Patescibacteria group bacterium]|nr:hypothetical protein [Patescibacteria group bacterium]